MIARTTKGKCVTAVASSDICLVDRTYTLKETSGFEKRQVATCRISHLLSNSDVTRSKTIRLSQGCLDKDSSLSGGKGVLDLFNVHSNIHWRAANTVYRTLLRFIGWLHSAKARPALGNSSRLPRNGSEVSCIPVCNRCGPLEKFKAVLRAKYVE